MAAEPVDAIVLDLGLAGHMTGREVARLARDRGIAVLLVTGQCPAAAEDIAIACLGKPHSASALVSALKAVESMTCKNQRSEEHTPELKSLMRIAYAALCLKKNTQQVHHNSDDSN